MLVVHHCTNRDSSPQDLYIMTLDSGLNWTSNIKWWMHTFFFGPNLIKCPPIGPFRKFSAGHLVFFKWITNRHKVHDSLFIFFWPIFETQMFCERHFGLLYDDFGITLAKNRMWLIVQTLSRHWFRVIGNKNEKLENMTLLKIAKQLSKTACERCSRSKNFNFTLVQCAQPHASSIRV